MSLAGARILVVGAGGFLGKGLVQRLRWAGASVVGAGRGVSGDARDALQLDATDVSRYERLVRSVAPDFVVHLTSDSRGGVDLDVVLPGLRDDVVASVNCLVACQRTGIVRVLLTTSMEEPIADEPAVTPYAAAKHSIGIYGKMFRKAYDLDVRLVRVFPTYGPGQKPFKIVPLVISRLLSGQPVHLKSPARAMDWIYLDDTVDGMMRALDRDGGYVQPIDIGTGTLTTIHDFVLEIAGRLGRPELVFDDGVNDRGVEMERRADVDEAERLLAWRARVPRAEGIARTIAWYDHLAASQPLP